MRSGAGGNVCIISIQTNRKVPRGPDVGFCILTGYCFGTLRRGMVVDFQNIAIIAGTRVEQRKRMDWTLGNRGR